MPHSLHCTLVEKRSGCYKSSVILRVLRSLWVDPKALIKTSDWVAEQKVGYQYNVVPCDTGSFAFSQHLPPTAGCPRLPKATSSFVRFSSRIRAWKTSPLSFLHVAYIIHKIWWASGLAMLMSGAYVVNGFLVFSKLFFLLFFFSRFWLFGKVWWTSMLGCVWFYLLNIHCCFEGTAFGVSFLPVCVLVKPILKKSFIFHFPPHFKLSVFITIWFFCVCLI